MTPQSYPKRVTQLENGTFVWRCAVDEAQTKQAYRITLWVCGGICVFLLLVGAVTDPWVLRIMVPCCAAVMAIAAGVCLIFKKLGGWDEFYWMDDEYLRIGMGRATRIYEYEKLRRVVISDRTIRLEKKIGKETVFIPEEDFPLVKTYILCRIPGTTEVEREFT